MAIKQNYRRKPQKISNAAKLTITALSCISFISSWNFIGRLENNEAQAAEAIVPQPTVPPLPLKSAPLMATPWPTIAPLISHPAIPTLVPTLTTFEQPSNKEVTPIQLEPMKLAPIPTPIAIPTLAPLPTIPPPPSPPLQPQPQPVQQRHQSGGS